MRYLYRIDDGALFAYAPQRRELFLASDDTLWAHESHSLLLAAASSVTLLRRIGVTYYDVATGLPLYYEGPEPSARSDGDVRTGDRSSPATSNDVAANGTVMARRSDGRTAPQRVGKTYANGQLITPRSALALVEQRGSGAPE